MATMPMPMTMMMASLCGGDVDAGDDDGNEDDDDGGDDGDDGNDDDNDGYGDSYEDGGMIMTIMLKARHI